VDTNQAFDRIKDFFLIFTSIFYEALPFIVLGSIVAGVLEEFLPQSLVARIMPKSKFRAIALGAVLGLIFPMCECGIIPVMRRLLSQGPAFEFLYGILAGRTSGEPGGVAKHICGF